MNEFDSGITQEIKAVSELVENWEKLNQTSPTMLQVSRLQRITENEDMPVTLRQKAKQTLVRILSNHNQLPEIIEGIFID